MLDYEDFYTADLQKNRIALQEVFLFLGLDLPETKGMDCYLDPGTAKINGQTTYRMLPNAVAINDRFGNDKTGWLFEKDLSSTRRRTVRAAPARERHRSAKE